MSSSRMKDEYSVTVLGSDLQRSSSNGGSCCSIFILILSGIYGVACLAVTLLARLYLRTYYLAANMAALAFFIAVFVWIHHLVSMQKILAIHKRVFIAFQFFLNLLFLCCCLCMGVCYTTIFAMRSSPFNLDVMSAFCWSWVNAVLFLYLLCSPYCMGSVEVRRKAADPSLNDLNRNGFRANIPPDDNASNRGCCAKCVYLVLRLIFWFVYVVTQLLFIIFFLGSAYQAAASLRDSVEYRKEGTMYEVQVQGHDKLGVYMLCRGSSRNGTILYEHGLGDELHLAWSFIPTELSKKYKVCAYDRRGYGWSDTYEQDQFGILRDEPQSAYNNVEFTKALVEATNISTPFYHLGYGYGGHHTVYMALRYPAYIKGIILLDSSDVTGLSDVDVKVLEALANFNPTGLIRFALQTGIYDYEDVDTDFPFDSIPDSQMDEFVASSFTNNYFASYLREKRWLDDDGWDHIKSLLRGKTIKQPVLLIDTTTNSSWFPAANFPSYDVATSKKYLQKATHETIAYSKQFAEDVAELVDEFIQNTSS